MARRITPGELRRKLQEMQRKQKQAVDKYNQAVRKHNQDVNRAVNKYNQDVRTHNSRVRVNRQRLLNEFKRLLSRPASTTSGLVAYRTSVTSMHQVYTRLEQREQSHELGPAYNRVLDLSEREAANSVEVANRILNPNDLASSDTDTLEDAELIDQLREISTDLDGRWQGAVFALNPRNPDAARHFCTSAREILTQVLETVSPDSEVLRALPRCDKTEHGRPTRRSKIKYLLYRRGMTEHALEEFVEQDMENIVQLFRVFNDGTHGAAGTFNAHQLASIRKRVKDAIFYIVEIARIP